MAYKYSLDPTYQGTWRFSPRECEIVQVALNLLLLDVETWNNRAIEHGAVVRPYEREAEDLKCLVDVSSSVEALGITVGCLRYIKAALLLLSARREAEVAAKVRENWPITVISSIQESNRPIMVLAEAINFPPADILSEITVGLGQTPASEAAEWDVFICHASEDKDFARPLAEILRTRGLRVWLDETVLRVGDSLRRTIDSGLARSRFGAVILSPNFLMKEWPQKELDGLAAQEIAGRKVILPIWHKIDLEGIRQYSPTLADRMAAQSARGLESVAEDLMAAIAQ